MLSSCTIYTSDTNTQSLKYVIILVQPIPYFLDSTPGLQSAYCVLRAWRQMEQRCQFERLILKASRTYYAHSTRRQNEQRCLKRVGHLIEERRCLHFLAYAHVGRNNSPFEKIVKLRVYLYSSLYSLQ